MTDYAKLAGELRRLLLKLPADAYTKLTGAEQAMLAGLEGGKLLVVPSEPTNTIANEGVLTGDCRDTENAKKVYRAMTQAAQEE